MRRFLPMAGAAAIAVLSLGSMKSLLGLGTQTIEELDVFSKALLPTLAAAVAAGGGAVTAGTGQVIAVCFADALITLIRGLLLPMTYFLAAAATADAMLPRHGLGTVAKAASRVVTWLLTGSLVLFTGYLTLSGAVSTSADALMVQATRSAVGAMPVVGRILSDAAGSVLAGAGVVKNAIGVFGLLGVLAGLLLLLLPTGKSSGQERQTSDDTQLYSLEETERRMAQLLGRMSGVGRVQVMLSLKTGPTLQLAQDMDLEQEEGSLRQRSQPVTVNRGSGWQEALVTRQDYPVYQGAVVVCQGAGSSAVRLAVTEAVAALTGLSTEKITVVQWEQ